MKALGKCEDGKVLGRVAANPDCHADSMTALLIARAQAKLQRRLSAHCGGADGICGTGDDDSLASIGWGSITSCPKLENGACNMAVNNCADIGACLLCIDEAAVDQAMTLYYGALDSMQFGTASPLNSCQRAIGSAPTQFVESKSKALQKCWDARLKGLHSNSCPTPGDGIAAGRIQRAQVKAMGAIFGAAAAPIWPATGPVTSRRRRSASSGPAPR